MILNASNAFTCFLEFPLSCLILNLKLCDYKQVKLVYRETFLGSHDLFFSDDSVKRYFAELKCKKKKNVTSENVSCYPMFSLADVHQQGMARITNEWAVFT